ncbi:hypothetical protein GTW40_11720 [Streptomyces sp. SID4985]|uniref:hypothetical protein n=1 Tax=Streptomyces sp. SID4985 TaxID=2690292 RepID=UPI00136AC3DF|nr:hypothetical protein [Streptomyces sp. SID4985]MYQ45722.1 hypothetical protein [Streptomyces sp. SID4985]
MSMLPPPPPQPPYPTGGAPFLPPSPKQRWTGRIVGGVLALGVAGATAQFLFGDAVDSGLPRAKYELALPQRLMDDEFVLAQDLSGTEGRKIEDRTRGTWGAEDIHALVALYDRGDNGTDGTMVVSGVYGRFSHQDRVRRAMLEGATGASRATVAGPAKDVTPPGSDIVASCQVLHDTASDVELAYPACAWADGNTGAVVVAADLTAEDPADVDLDAAARDTLKIRTEMLRPVG